MTAFCMVMLMITSADIKNDMNAPAFLFNFYNDYIYNFEYI